MSRAERIEDPKSKPKRRPIPKGSLRAKRLALIERTRGKGRLMSIEEAADEMHITLAAFRARYESDEKQATGHRYFPPGMIIKPGHKKADAKVDVRRLVVVRRIFDRWADAGFPPPLSKREASSGFRTPSSSAERRTR